MIQDYQTNKVYLAKGLSYYMPLSMLIVENLKCHGIDFAWLPRTENDNYIWARDYMPIQLEKDLFLQYQYNPDYLKRYRGWIPPYKAICKDLGANSALNVPSGAFSNVPSVTDSNVPLQTWLL